MPALHIPTKGLRKICTMRMLTTNRCTQQKIATGNMYVDRRCHNMYSQSSRSRHRPIDTDITTLSTSGINSHAACDRQGITVRAYAITHQTTDRRLNMPFQVHPTSRTDRRASMWARVYMYADQPIRSSIRACARASTVRCRSPAFTASSSITAPPPPALIARYRLPRLYRCTLSINIARHQVSPPHQSPYRPNNNNRPQPSPFRTTATT